MATNSEVALRRFSVWFAVGLTVGCLAMVSYGLVVMLGDPAENELTLLDVEEELPMREIPLEFSEPNWPEAEEASGSATNRST